ncbi:hypothetical protein YC2023_050738 [Brassica napus]|uniref:Uncharacterized protein n=1 Tax=Brassica oleracea TaxID=3712 RepID=A0A3P6BRB2_BRAOL|nr:unnamed protein product [Brassica oleracea]
MRKLLAKKKTMRKLEEGVSLSVSYEDIQQKRKTKYISLLLCRSGFTTTWACRQSSSAPLSIRLFHGSCLTTSPLIPFQTQVWW